MWCGLDYVRARMNLIFCEGLPQMGLMMYVFNPFFVLQNLYENKTDVAVVMPKTQPTVIR
jgi:hypothetical protein